MEELVAVTFRLAGDLLHTTVAELRGALADGAWKISSVQEDELELEADDWSLAIYSSGIQSHERWDFLVSGELEGSLEAVKETVQALAGRLTAAGIVYDFETANDTGLGFVERHPKF